jgi:4-aminobutyrate aminotransferase-like enzyme
MDELLREIYSMDKAAMDEAAGHVMLGGGTRGMPTVVRGEGVHIYDVDGKSYIDCTSQSWALYLGFANPELSDFVSEHLRNMSHVHQGFDTPMRFYLAKLLADLAPGDLNRVSFTVGGGPAIEAAMKICAKNTQPSRDFICLWDSYHGTTLGSMGASWISTRSSGKLVGGSRFLPLTHTFVRVPNPYCYRCYFGLERGKCDLMCARFLETTIQKGVAGNAAGFIMEPIQASGGQIIAPQEYVQEVRRICTRHGVPLVFDEIQTYCRIGEFFASDYFQVAPDVIVLGKGLGAGFPIAAVIVSDKLEGFTCDGEELHTFANNSVSQVAAIKQIKMMQDWVLDNCRKQGAYLRQGLERLQQQYPEIGDIRQAGLHIGVEMVKDPVTKEPLGEEESNLIRKSMMERGVILGVAGPVKHILKVKPPLIVKREECDLILEAFADTLKATLRPGISCAAARG